MKIDINKREAKLLLDALQDLRIAEDLKLGEEGLQGRALIAKHIERKLIPAAGYERICTGRPPEP